MAVLRSMAAALSILLAAGALSACGTPGPGDPPDHAAKTGGATGNGIALLTGVGIGQSLDFDRISFRFRGPGTPGFRVSYVEAPIVEDGSGAPVEIEGEHYVEIRMEPASGADLGGPELVITYPGPHRLAGPAGGIIREAARTGDFEAVLTWVVGLGSRAPFRVSRGTEPNRIVVEFARP